MIIVFTSWFCIFTFCSFQLTFQLCVYLIILHDIYIIFWTKMLILLFVFVEPTPVRERVRVVIRSEGGTYTGIILTDCSFYFEPKSTFTCFSLRCSHTFRICRVASRAECSACQQKIYGLQKQAHSICLPTKARVSKKVNG